MKNIVYDYRNSLEEKMLMGEPLEKNKYETGHFNYENVCGVIFAYCRKNYADIVQTFIFTEDKTIVDNRNRQLIFADYADLQIYVLHPVLLKDKPEEVIRWRSVFHDYLILLKIINQLDYQLPFNTPYNVIKFIVPNHYLRMFYESFDFWREYSLPRCLESPRTYRNSMESNFSFRNTSYKLDIAINERYFIGYGSLSEPFLDMNARLYYIRKDVHAYNQKQPVFFFNDDRDYFQHNELLSYYFAGILCHIFDIPVTKLHFIIENPRHFSFI